MIVRRGRMNGKDSVGRYFDSEVEPLVRTIDYAVHQPRIHSADRVAFPELTTHLRMVFP
jgi:hypothetical protein